MMSGLIFGNGRIMGARRNSGGFSLVELLVGVALGLFLLFGIVTVFEKAIRGSVDNLASARLNQELSAVMEMMVNDIRRSGYVDTASNTGAVFQSEPGGLDMRIPSESCILFSYDEDSDGAALEDSERHGFRLSNNAVERRVSATVGEAGDCSAGAGQWQALTDTSSANRRVRITDLRFSTAAFFDNRTDEAKTESPLNLAATSKCVSRVRDAHWFTSPRDDLAEVINWFPCSVASSSSVVVAGTASVTFPVTELRVETRQIYILLEGEIVDPSSGAITAQKRIYGSVKVANDFPLGS